MKAKRVRKNNASTKTTQRCVIEEESEVLGVKPLRRALSSNRSTRQSVRIHGLVRDPPRFLKTVSCLALWIPQQASCFICHPWLLSMFPSSIKTSLNTMKGCGKCLDYQPLNDMEWRGRS